MFGPENAELTVHTKRAGAAAKAGHDLTLLVERWSATVDGDAVTLDADPRSLRVVKGAGGITSLGDEEKAAITRTIDKEVLKGQPIRYADGALTLNGVTRPIDVTWDGTEGRARVKQTDFKIKPYSALFGTLRVADEVEVRVRRIDG
ncbi:YceI family protein [Solirubrobacter sp. CPCC 204708]|uniref:YceI family protein n=1 Tax=Solirubrobacter deserti TaxID=2282478 RepID=A0ABT4RQ44_9ACTN|nr:YceI family protein [Solirubrobacter deserti]MBE2320635.1 YceI family protein [Solirubrobacter deserti]MDA0140689.1 YceI family protein [Solirubrobacter deserti]